MMFQCMLLDDKGLSERNVSQNRLNERLIDDKSGLNDVSTKGRLPMMVGGSNWDKIGGTTVKHIVLYTKKDCPLCLEAKMNLMLVGEIVPLKIEERDIEEKDEWMEKYGMMIPVVEYDGEMIQYGRVDYPTLLGRLK